MDCVLCGLFFLYSLCGLYECGLIVDCFVLYLMRTCAVDCKLNICELYVKFIIIVYGLCFLWIVCIYFVWIV